MDANQIVELDLNYVVESVEKELEILSGEKVLLTGGAGFLGYYFTKTILHWNALRIKKGFSTINLTLIDNFIRGLPDWLSEINQNKNLVIREHDILDPLPNDITNIKYIIHAASIASPKFYRKHPIETMDANVNGLRNLLDYFSNQVDKGKVVGSLLYFSTSEIYGDPDPKNIPTSETYRGNVSSTGPRASYDESKRYGETLCVNFSRHHNLPIKIARPFNNYGPGLKITDGRALSDFFQNVILNQDIVLYSDGSPTRTFCYVADAIIGYFKILLRGKSGEAYNIGTELPELSIGELAQMVIDISEKSLGYKGKLIFKLSDDEEYLIDNPSRRCPCIDKARKDLNYEPKIELREGLKRTLIWYRDNYYNLKSS